MRRHWTVSTTLTGRPRDVDIFLYDKLGHMRQAASRHSNRWDNEQGALLSALAVTHGFRHIELHGDGTETERPKAAIIRFTRGYLATDLIAHEVAHAAQHLYRLDCVALGDLAEDHMDSSNEKFAYLTGELFSAVWLALADEQVQIKYRKPPEPTVGFIPGHDEATCNDPTH